MADHESTAPAASRAASPTDVHLLAHAVRVIEAYAHRLRGDLREESDLAHALKALFEADTALLGTDAPPAIDASALRDAAERVADIWFDEMDVSYLGEKELTPLHDAIHRLRTIVRPEPSDGEVAMEELRQAFKPGDASAPYAEPEHGAETTIESEADDEKELRNELEEGLVAIYGAAKAIDRDEDETAGIAILIEREAFRLMEVAERILHPERYRSEGRRS